MSNLGEIYVFMFCACKQCIWENSIYNKTIVLKSVLVLKLRVCFGTLLIQSIFFFCKLFVALPWKVNKNEIELFEPHCKS